MEISVRSVQYVHATKARTLRVVASLRANAPGYRLPTVLATFTYTLGFSLCTVPDTHRREVPFPCGLPSAFPHRVPFFAHFPVLFLCSVFGGFCGGPHFLKRCSARTVYDRRSFSFPIEDAPGSFAPSNRISEPVPCFNPQYFIHCAAVELRPAIRGSTVGPQPSMRPLGVLVFGEKIAFKVASTSV